MKGEDEPAKEKNRGSTEDELVYTLGRNRSMKKNRRKGGLGGSSTSKLLRVNFDMFEYH